MPIKGQSPKEVMHTEMSAFKHGELHSGSKHGPVVKSRKQAIAIGLSESRKAGHKVAKKSLVTKSKHIPTAPGHRPAVHNHEEPMGHKLHGPSGHPHDGAGRKGHDMELHHYTEHKAPHHPEGSHTKQHEDAPKSGHGPYGYPGAH